MSYIYKWFIVLGVFAAVFGGGKAAAQGDVASFKAGDTVLIKKLLQKSIAFIRKEGEYKADIDSGLSYAEQALAYSLDPSIDRTWWRRSMEQKGLCYVEARDVADGKRCFIQVIDFLNKKGDKKGEAALWVRLGESIDDHQNEMSREKENCFRHARNIYIALGDSLNAALELKNIGDVHLNEGRLDLAGEELLQVLESMKRMGYKKLYNTYYLLSAVSRLKGDQKKELYYRIEVIKSMKETGDSTDAGLFYGKLAETYDALEMYDQSILYREYAIASDRRTGAFDWMYGDLQDLSQTMIAAGRGKDALARIETLTRQEPPSDLYQRNFLSKTRGNCFAALQQNEKAEACYLRMISTSDSLFKGKLWSEEDLIRDYLTIGNFYISQNQYSRAEAYISRMLLLPQKIVGPIYVSQIHLQKFKVDSASGRLASAITHFEVYQRINDSLITAQKQRQINELQIQYETSQKDKDLQLQATNIQLLTKQTELQKSESENGRILRNVLLTGLGMVLLLLIVVYSRYRLKIRTNRALEQHQREISQQNEELQRLLQDNEWLLKEVHHRVKNNLQVVVSLLSSQSAYLQDKNALDAVLDSQHRIQAMSLIHQKLYKSNNASSVYMPDYVADLVEYLRESFTTRQRIFFKLEIEEIALDAVEAVPLGLILNEAITNSIKYAFPYSNEDAIEIRLFSGKADEGKGARITLIISDNGKGLPEGFDVETTQTFGLILIKGLAEDLRGEVVISGEAGKGVGIEVVWTDFPTSNASA